MVPAFPGGVTPGSQRSLDPAGASPTHLSLQLGRALQQALPLLCYTRQLSLQLRSLQAHAAHRQGASETAVW